jgi:quinol monooxygenase YgiN
VLTLVLVGPGVIWRRHHKLLRCWCGKLRVRRQNHDAGYDAVMSTIALLELRLKPEDLEAGMRVLEEVLVATRGFAGNEGVEVLVDTADPAHVVVHEKWASLEADGAYRAWRAGEGASDLGSVLAAAPVLTVLTPAASAS